MDKLSSTMILKVIRKKIQNDTRCTILLKGRDEKILPIYWRTIYKRGAKYLELFHPPSQINCDVDIVV